jgi:hypothetical protein
MTLITETVQAVSQDDHASDPRWWGAKNHHLLLAPLLLSANSEAYQAARSGLSALIAVSQAGDEWIQGVMNEPELAGLVLSHIPLWLDEATWLPLQQQGWTGAARQLLFDARRLIQRLSPISHQMTAPV